MKVRIRVTPHAGRFPKDGRPGLLDEDEVDLEIEDGFIRRVGAPLASAREFIDIDGRRVPPGVGDLSTSDEIIGGVRVEVIP